MIAGHETTEREVFRQMDFALLSHAPTASLDDCAIDLAPIDVAAGSSSGPPTQSAVGDMGPPTQWRRRRRPVNAEPSDEEVDDDDNNSVVSGQWQPDAADVEMVTGLSLIEALPMGRMRVDSNRVVRRAKRMKLDLEASASLGETLGEAASVEGGMFAELSLVADKSPDQHAGGALLCFLSQETFVGFVELLHEARPPTVPSPRPVAPNPEPRPDLNCCATGFATAAAATERIAAAA